MAGPIVIHSLDHARAALAAAAELGVPVMLASAQGAAGNAGPAWFGEVVAAACAEFSHLAVSAVLDCGDAPGHVLAAVRWCGAPDRPRLVLRFTGDATLAGKLDGIARAAGLTLVRDLGPALDLFGMADPPAACRAWLAGAMAR